MDILSRSRNDALNHGGEDGVVVGHVVGLDGVLHAEGHPLRRISKPVHSYSLSHQ